MKLSLTVPKQIKKLKSRAQAYLSEKPRMKAAAIVMLGTVVFGSLGGTTMVAADSADQVAPAGGNIGLTRGTEGQDTGSSGTVQKMQEADIMSIQLFPTSPFKQGTMTSEQKFDQLMRDTTVTGNWEFFQKASEEIVKKTGMCQGGTGTIDEQLKQCAQTRPEEFGQVSNAIRSYFEWQNTELRTVRELYRDKITSPLMRDRVEARLVNECMRTQMAKMDTANAINVCRDPKNWPVEKTFYAGCQGTGGSASTFDYKEYMSKCVIGNTVKSSLGAALAFSMVPNFKIQVTNEGITTTTTPLTDVPSTAYHAIYELVYSYISSGWFNQMATKGCLPSIFAPENFGSMSPDERAKYYSVCIPQTIVQKVSALPQVDADFFRSIIARRIAMIQTVEMLNGALMISEEAYGNLNSNDREIGLLAEGNVRLLQKFVDAYNRSIDLTFGKKLDDVLEQINDLFGKYDKEIGEVDRGTKAFQGEMAEMKEHQKTGE